MSKPVTVFGVISMMACSWSFADSRPPTNHLTVKAEQLELNQKTGIQTLSGNVVIKQGNFLIYADTIQVTTIINGAISRITGTGSPIRFQQSISNGETIKTESKNIDYVTSRWTLVFSGDVKLQKGNWHLTSEIIEYNIRSRNFRASNSRQPDQDTKTSPPQIRFSYGN